MLQPHLPRVLRDAVVDALAQLVVPRFEIEARQLLSELCALDHPRHRTLPRGRPCITQSRPQRDRGAARRRSACPPSCQAMESATLFLLAPQRGHRRRAALVLEPARNAVARFPDGSGVEPWSPARHRGARRDLSLAEVASPCARG